MSHLMWLARDACAREEGKTESEILDFPLTGDVLNKKLANLRDHSKWWEVCTIGTEGRNLHIYPAPTEQM